MTEAEILLLKICLYSRGESLYTVWKKNELNSPSVVYSMLQQGFIELYETTYDGLNEEENFKKTTVRGIDELKDDKYWRHKSQDGEIYYKLIATQKGKEFHKNDKSVRDFWLRKQNERVEKSLEFAESERKETELIDDPTYLEALVRDYFHYWHLQAAAFPTPPFEDPYDYDKDQEINGLIDRDPDRGWKLVLKLIECAPCVSTMYILAAGPLENIFKWFGSYVVNKIDDDLLNNSRFKMALSGVWLDEDEDQAYSHLFKLDNHWQDESPERHKAVKFEHDDCKTRFET